MQMSRIAELPIEQWDARLRTSVNVKDLSPLEKKSRSMLANAPHMALANGSFLAIAMPERKLPSRLLELVRLRIAFHNQCRSCMAMRFQAPGEEVVGSDLVCSLEKPMEAPNLTDREKAALEYADIFATNHFAITDQTFEKLHQYFNDAEIVELAMFCGYYVGFGRFLSVLDLTEELPKVYQDKSHKVAPWQTNESVVVRG
jgi:alkylhydroperoxidase family enzyme